jgi:hypothetical protein
LVASGSAAGCALDSGGVIAIGNTGPKNRWQKCELAKGKLEGLKLVAPAQMLRLETLNPDRIPSTAMFNQRDRTRQRGATACRTILEAVLKNVAWTADEAVLFVEWHPGNSADWTRAVRELQTGMMKVQSGTLSNTPHNLWHPCPSCSNFPANTFI